MGYTKYEIVSMTQKSAADISTFYKCDFINYRGVTSNSNEETVASLAKKKKLDAVICYDMASNLNIIFGASCNDYTRFLEIQNPLL